MTLSRAPILLSLVVLVAGCGSGEPPLESASALEILAISDAQARRQAVDSLISGQHYGLVTTAGRAFKALPEEKRRRLVEAMGNWGRDYFRSDAFADAYAEQRARSMPLPVEYEESVDEELARWSREGLAQLEEMRTSVLPQLSPADRAQMLEGLAAMQQQFEDAEYAALQRQSIEMTRAGDGRNYRDAMDRWSNAFPEDADVLVARRLQAFVDACADVDFSAGLEERHGQLRFVNAEYERRSDVWKLCFRAGRESVEAALEEARDWLAELR